jgi:hypothetical protein
MLDHDKLKSDGLCGGVGIDSQFDFRSVAAIADSNRVSPSNKLHEKTLVDTKTVRQPTPREEGILV